MQAKKSQGWGWSPTCARERCDLVLSWRPPALPPEPRQKLHRLMSVFLALFHRYHMPAADFPLLVAPCTGGAMLTLVSDMAMLQHYAWERKSLQPPAAQFKTSLELTLAPP